MPVPPVVRLTDRFASFSDHWSPKVLAQVNDCEVKAAKLKGEFVWHHHANEDEMFLVMEGTLRIQFRDGEAVLRPGELVVVPRGVEHRPVAEEEVHVLLFEPKGTLNTGNVRNERTVERPERI